MLANLTLDSFARISHLVVEPNGALTAHLIWLTHSSSILQEGHHPRELFWTRSCATVHPSVFHHKVEIEVLDPSKPVPTSRIDDEQFFVRYNFAPFLTTTASLNQLLLIGGCGTRAIHRYSLYQTSLVSAMMTCIFARHAR